jgi:hypothetical protein
MSRRTRARIRLVGDRLAVKVADADHREWATGEVAAMRDSLVMVMRGMGIDVAEGAVIEHSPQSCAQCGSSIERVYIAMEPGHDRKPWALCRRCWS